MERGDLLPEIKTDLPGPNALKLSDSIRRVEAPGINTLYNDHPNIFWHSAKGSNVVDVDGNRYIDLTAGFGVQALGHGHPKIMRAVRQQTDLLTHSLGDAIGHPGRIQLAEKLLQHFPGRDGKVYFAISGADAVEIAVKTALLFHRGRRSRILAFRPSYHGLTLGAVNLGSRPDFKAPFADHLSAQIHHLAYGCPVAQIEDLFLEHGDFAAVVFEPIVGREGILIPPPAWLDELAKTCNRFDVLTIADEIFTGFGRTGYPLAVDHDEMSPDLVCCGKGMTGGMPIAAVIGKSHLMDAWRTSGEALHTATFVAHPVACATACVALEEIERQRLPARAAELGRYIQNRTTDWSRRFASLVEVRGRGLMWGLELSGSDVGRRFGSEAWKRGILLLVGGPEGKVAQIVPPLTISKHQLDFSLNELESLLAQLDP